MDTTQVEQAITNWTQKQPTWSPLQVKLEKFDGASLCANLSVFGTEEGASPHSFQLFFDDKWDPMFIMSADSTLEEWNNKINARLQSKPLFAQTLDSLLQELKNSLLLVLKPALASAPAPTEVAAPNNDTTESSAPEVDLTSPVARIKDEINKWAAAHPALKLSIAAVYESDYQISFTLTEQFVAFQVFCTNHWTPMIIMTEHPLLQDFLPVANGILEQSSASGTPLTLVELFDHLAKTFAEKLGIDSSAPSTWDADAAKEETGLPADKPAAVANPDASADGEAADEPADDEPAFVQATDDDWRKIIVPGIRQFLIGDNFQLWEVDEWVRQLEQAKQAKGINSALGKLRDELLSGSPAPQSFRRFVPKWRAVGFEGDDEDVPLTGGFDVMGGSEAATKRLLEELKQIQQANTKPLGFHAVPIGKHLYLWSVSMFGFDSDTELGRDLASFSVIHSATGGSAYSAAHPIDILFELHFSADYPSVPPMIRLIRPRFVDAVDVDLFSELLRASGDDVPNTTEGSEPSNIAGGHPLSMSMQLEKKQASSWNASTCLLDLLARIRKALETLPLRVDMESPKDGLATIGGFWKTYSCMSASSQHRSDEECGGKILLPISVLEFLYPQSYTRYSYGHDMLRQSSETPMIFEISSSTSGRRTFCGVLEFVAPDGCALLPNWMMKALNINEFEPVQVRRVKLPKGTFAKLQPHSTNFHQIPNPKAMLEWRLRSYVAISRGDTITVQHNGKSYQFNVLETKPGRAIGITDSDLSVEFAEALTEAAPDEKDRLLSSSTEVKPPPPTTSGHGSTEGGQEGVDFKVCSNCRNNIPIASFGMHEIQCSRINYFCEKCQQGVKKVDKQKHEDEVHAVTPCHQCSQAIEKRWMKNHLKQDCPYRKVQCQYCEIFIPFRERFEHETNCGSITEQCESCNRRITRREKFGHVCGEQTSTPASPSFGNPTNPPGASRYTGFGSDTFVCEKCQQPCDGFDELQVHYLTVHDGEAEN